MCNIWQRKWKSMWPFLVLCCCLTFQFFRPSDEKNCDFIPAVMHIKLLMLGRALSSIGWMSCFTVRWLCYFSAHVSLQEAEKTKLSPIFIWNLYKIFFGTVFIRKPMNLKCCCVIIFYKNKKDDSLFVFVNLTCQVLGFLHYVFRWHICRW